MEGQLWSTNPSFELTQTKGKKTKVFKTQIPLKFEAFDLGQTIFFLIKQKMKFMQ